MSKGVKIILVVLVIVLIGVALKMKGIIGGGSMSPETDTEMTTDQTSDTTTTDGGDQAGQLSEKEVQKYVKAVNKLFLGLPADEDPIIAKIIDVEALRSEQQFYKDAANDDVLVIYPSVAKAIIYRPATDQIVNAGPLIVNEDAEAQASGTSADN